MEKENMLVTCWAWVVKPLDSSSHWNSAAAERPESLEESFVDFPICYSGFQRRRMEDCGQEKYFGLPC